MLSKRLFTAACAAAILTMSAAPAHAQGGPMDLRTEFTFSQPVELPGVTLPPGTYIFRFADATTGRMVMQVQAKDQSSKTYGMFMTISAQRPKPSDDAELRFMETPAGQPTAVKTWWYPGRTIGREFIYPKSQARRLAQATSQTVLTTKAEDVTNEQMKTADLSYVSPTGQDTALTDEQLVDAAANTPPQGVSAGNTATGANQSGAANTSGANNSSAANMNAGGANASSTGAGAASTGTSGTMGTGGSNAARQGDASSANTTTRTRLIKKEEK
jgi:hypothetical protein